MAAAPTTFKERLGSVSLIFAWVFLFHRRVGGALTWFDSCGTALFSDGGL